MQAHHSEWLACYHKAQETSPLLLGKTSFSFQIDPSGKVVNSKIIETTFGTDNLNSCILTRLNAVKFPAVDGFVTDVGRFPLYFNPKSGGVTTEEFNAQKALFAVLGELKHRCYFWNQKDCPEEISKSLKARATELKAQGSETAKAELIAQAKVEVENGNLAKALDAYDLSLYLDPSAASAWCGAGRVYEKLGEIALAKQLIGKGKKLNARAKECISDKR